VLRPLFELQRAVVYARENELLIEQIETKDGWHLFVYPFEGRLVHEAMAACWLTDQPDDTDQFPLRMNDYGFELLSDQPIPVDDTKSMSCSARRI